MKYWYLEKYRSLKVTELNDLKDDLNFFIEVPKYKKKEGEILLAQNIKELNEEELLKLIHYILYVKKSALNKIVPIIESLLKIPDNSMPITDYSLKEMLNEIKNLGKNKAYKEKLENNNIAACFNCLNVFYTDKITYINKKQICLCPYCKSTNLYFDNDYIPMDFFFLKLSRLYYKETTLGCNFKNIQKLLKRSVNFTNDECHESIVLKSDILASSKVLEKSKKITTKEELKLLYCYHEKLKEYDLSYNFNLTIEVPALKKDKNKHVYSLFLLIYISTLFGNNPYLKKVFIRFKRKSDEDYYKKVFKIFTSFS